MNGAEAGAVLSFFSAVDRLHFLGVLLGIRSVGKIHMPQ